MGEPLRRLASPARLRVAAVVLVLLGAAWVVGSHGHSHGAIRIADSAGGSALVQEWRPGQQQGDGAVVSSGHVQFDFTNTDGQAHDFAIVRSGEGGEPIAAVDPAAPGESVHTEFDLPPGEYVIFCTLPGHADQGMRYQLTVKDGG